MTRDEIIRIALDGGIDDFSLGYLMLAFDAGAAAASENAALIVEELGKYGYGSLAIAATIRLRAKRHQMHNGAQHEKAAIN